MCLVRGGCGVEQFCHHGSGVVMTKAGAGACRWDSRPHGSRLGVRGRVRTLRENSGRRFCVPPYYVVVGGETRPAFAAGFALAFLARWRASAASSSARRVRALLTRALKLSSLRWL